jgi:Skp family chaperone for outer membrane proteins
MMKTIAVLLAFGLAVPAGALELSLEENRAERGSVGYVDMNRLFAAAPDAQRAKENFEDLVRQAEEDVNSRRAALLRLRQELDALKAERDTLARSTPTVVSPPAAPAPAPKAAAKAAKAEPAKAEEKPAPKEAPKPAASEITHAEAAPAPSAAAEQASPSFRRAPLSLPGFDMPMSSGSAVSVTAEPPLAINLPGVTTGQELAPVAEPEPKPQPKAEPKPEPAAVAVSSAPPSAAPVAAPVVDASAARLIELDGLIAARTAEIAPLEIALEKEQSSAERNLLDAESRRTDQVLARLYRAVSEVARREGVSVVVDKTAILYGHPAVDLTDRVLAYLRGPKQ